MQQPLIMSAIREATSEQRDDMDDQDELVREYRTGNYDHYGGHRDGDSQDGYGYEEGEEANGSDKDLNNYMVDDGEVDG